MTWIRTVGPEEAEGRLASTYKKVASADGQVDQILQAHSLRPRTLEGHLALYKAALHTPCGLTPRERELIGTVVSMVNGCDYCVQHHRAGLARHLGQGAAADPELALAITTAAVSDEPHAELTDRERAMVRYAIALTSTPSAMSREHVDALRRAGLDDASVLDVNQVAAYFAYANRTVLGLGVSIEGEPLGLHPEEGGEDLGHG